MRPKKAPATERKQFATNKQKHLRQKEEHLRPYRLETKTKAPAARIFTRPYCCEVNYKYIGSWDVQWTWWKTEESGGKRRRAGESGEHGGERRRNAESGVERAKRRGAEAALDWIYHFRWSKRSLPSKRMPDMQNLKTS